MHRIKQIFSNHPDDIDAILIKNPGESSVDENFYYLSGLDQGLYEGAYALITPDQKLDLFISKLEAESAHHTNATLHIHSTTNELNAQLQESLHSNKKIGLNYARIRLTDYTYLVKKHPDITFVDISKTLQTTRMIKDTDELEKIRQACKITDKVMNKIPEIIKTKINEFELAAEINYYLQKYGASHPAFDTISSFGPHSAEPHYTHGATMINDKDFIVCDFGGTYKRYNADMTRTFIFGTPTSYQKKIHDTVIHAQTVGFDTIQPGIMANKVHIEVAKAIDATEFKGKFIHSTGHALGLLVHDGPGFTGENDLILKENMVFTVEPGIYIPGLGGVRIEDDILITQKGFELLTNATRDLIEISH